MEPYAHVTLAYKDPTGGYSKLSDVVSRDPEEMVYSQVQNTGSKTIKRSNIE